MITALAGGEAQSANDLEELDRFLEGRTFHRRLTREGGAFRMLYPDGRVHIAGRVIEWSPPRRFACTWVVEGMAEFRDLPECLVTYEIEPSGESVRLTMTEAHSWDVPDDLLSGGRAGWPAILSSLKSVLETGKPLKVQMAPPQRMLEALKAMGIKTPS